MSRLAARCRSGFAALGVGLACVTTTLAVADEAVPAPEAAEARILGAWAALRGEIDPTPPPLDPVPDSSAAAPTQPAEPVPMVLEANGGGAPVASPVPAVAAPAMPGAPGAAAIGYAPEAGGTIFPADRAFAAGPRPIAVPMPRHRPSVPTVATQVAALDAAAGIGASSRMAEAPPILADEDVLGPPRKVPKEALPYLHLLKREAARQKVPLWLAIGVGFVESKYDPKLRGTHTVLGIMQVMPSTARFQGYRGTTEQLLDPETNIVWGMRELGWTWAAAKGDPCLAIAKYKGGIATKSISASAWNYCAMAKKVTGMM